MPTTLRSGLVLAGVLSVGLTACGGASSPTAATTPTSTATGPTAVFVAAADSICAKANAKESALGPGLVNPDIVTADHLSKAAAFLDSVIAIKQGQEVQLRAIAVPASDRSSVRALEAASDRVIADYQAAASAAQNGDLNGFRAAFDKVAPKGVPDGPDAQLVTTALHAFPFKECGTGSGL